MTSTRAVIVVVAAVGALLLTACGGSDDADAGRASSGTTSTSVVAPTTSAAVSTSPAPAVEPTTVAPVAVAAEPASPAPLPTTTVALPTPASPTIPAPRSAPGEIDSRSPEQIVADSGERGRRYLAALRAAGLPPTGMDAAEVLYAEGTCAALARGESRASVLAEFDSVGQAYARFLPIPADRTAEIYVSAAETTYC